MKNIKTYSTFNDDRLNEGLFDFLKKAFNQMFTGLSEIYTQQTQQVFKDIENQKNLKDVYTILGKFLVISKNNFDKDMTSAANLNKIRDAVYSNMVSLYAAFETGSKKLSNNRVSFDNAFGETPPKELKKIFNQKDVKKRESMMLEFSNSLIENLGVGIKLDPNDVDIMKKTIVGAKPEKDTTKIDTTKAAENEPTAANEPANDANANQEQEIKTGEKVADNYHYIAEKVSAEQKTNLKDLVVSWFDVNIYKKLDNTIKSVSKEPQQSTDIDNIVNSIKATNNKEGVKKMLQKIANLEDSRKYADVRDALVKLGIIGQDEIGKF